MFESLWVDKATLTSDELASAIRHNHLQLVAHENQVLELACAWADRHDLDPSSDDYQPLIERACYWGGEGTPPVSEYAAAEFGALQGIGIVAAQRLIGDALDLRYRLPNLWGMVYNGAVRAWQARKVAQATRPLSWDAARNVDEALAGCLGLVPWPRFERLLRAAILEADLALVKERAERARTEQFVYAMDSEDGLKTMVARASSGDVVWFLATVNRIAEILAAQGDSDPIGARRAKAIGILAQPARALQMLLDHRTDPDTEANSATEPEPAEPDPEDDHTSLDLRPSPIDPAAARPRVVLHFHLADEALRCGYGLVRPEHGGPLTLDQLREFLAGTGCQVRVQPIFDPTGQPAVDSYEIPAALRVALEHRHPFEVFPYGSAASRSATGRHLDQDHTRSYCPLNRGGPPGQTGLHNLGPFGRRGHRTVTHGGWDKRQPEPGTYTFRSPHGFVFVVTNQGTLNLGNNDFATAFWEAAKQFG